MVISWSSPVWARPAPASADCVCCRPLEPKSREWLLAMFIRPKPASRNTRAKDGGAWNAKQFARPPAHFDGPPWPSVPSRLPVVRSSPCSTLDTDEKTPAPPRGGSPLLVEKAMSPTQPIVTAGCGAAAKADGARARAIATVAIPARIGLRHRQAAAHRQRLPGDEACAVGCEEGHRRGNVLRLAEAAHRHRTRERVDQLLAA